MIKQIIKRKIIPSALGLVQKIQDPALILIYHRVTKLENDPHLLAVSPENFEAQMIELKKNFPIWRFEDKWPHQKGISITFDDGYADNFLEALPILEKHQIPATIFVSTDQIEGQVEYWWDELEQLPAHLVPEGLHARLKFMTSEARRERMDELFKKAGVTPVLRQSHRPLTMDELRKLAASPVITIGAHTQGHSALAGIHYDRQKKEIEISRAKLESWIGKKVTVFSYPFGGLRDYNADSVRICREAGFTKVASCFAGQYYPWTSEFEIPRALIRNWETPRFRDELKKAWTKWR